jgi:hypothetical protein
VLLRPPRHAGDDVEGLAVASTDSVRFASRPVALAYFKAVHAMMGRRSEKRRHGDKE